MHFFSDLRDSGLPRALLVRQVIPKTPDPKEDQSVLEKEEQLKHTLDEQLFRDIGKAYVGSLKEGRRTWRS